MIQRSCLRKELRMVPVAKERLMIVKFSLFNYETIMTHVRGWC